MYSYILVAHVCAVCARLRLFNLYDGGRKRQKERKIERNRGINTKATWVACVFSIFIRIRQEFVSTMKWLIFVFPSSTFATPHVLVHIYILRTTHAKLFIQFTIANVPSQHWPTQFAVAKPLCHKFTVCAVLCVCFWVDYLLFGVRKGVRVYRLQWYKRRTSHRCNTKLYLIYGIMMCTLEAVHCTCELEPILYVRTRIIIDIYPCLYLHICWRTHGLRIINAINLIHLALAVWQNNFVSGYH